MSFIIILLIIIVVIVVIVVEIVVILDQYSAFTIGSPSQWLYLLIDC
jgi:hypothetical protein